MGTVWACVLLVMVLKQRESVNGWSMGMCAYYGIVTKGVSRWVQYGHVY